MNHFKKAIFIFLLSVYGKHVLSQENQQQIVPVSPEAAALAKMVNYPINYNTGIPDIRIPFYEINVGGLKLPIELVYHAGGFRINEQATRAGLGWSISSDLQITRTVNGSDDFRSFPLGYIPNTRMKNYYPGNSTATCPNCPYPFWDLTPFPYANAYELATGEKDGMPDKFNYKLLNKSGSFYFMKNDAGTSYSIVPVPYDNVRIRYDNGRFIITDSDGTIYYFGESGTSGDLGQLPSQGVEVSGSIDGGTCINCSRTAWKCKRIVNATGTDELNFSYVAKGVATYRTYRDKVEHYSNPNPCGLYPKEVYYPSDQPPLSPYDNYEQIKHLPFYAISSPKYWVRFGNSATSYLHVPYESGGVFMDKVFSYLEQVIPGSSSGIAGLSLSEITFRGGRVVFNGADQLNSIRVFDSKNNEIKSLYFFHSYKQAGYVSEAQYYNGYNFQGTRYLDSLHLRNGTSTYERYALVYMDKFCYGNHLKGHDAWGYPNGRTMEIAYANNVTGNLLSLPSKRLIHPKYYNSIWNCAIFKADLPLTIGGSDWAEAVDETAMQRGILKRIVYPTGGFVDFDFEANRYDELVDGGWRTAKLPQMGGGLRIRSISYYDPLDQHPINYRLTSQQYFRYGDVEQGTGVLVSRPKLASSPNAINYEAVSYEQEVVYLYGPANSWPPCDQRSCLGIRALEIKTTYEPASVLDYTYANGAPVYYTKVSEYKQDLGTQTGRTVYEYYPPGEFHDSYYAPLREESRVANTNIPYLKTDGLMGALKSVTTYKAVSDYVYEPVHRKAFEYTRHLRPQQVRVVYAFLRVIYQLVEGYYSGAQHLYDNSVPLASSPNYSPGQEYITDEYGIAVGCLLKTSEEETYYEQGKVLTTVNLYNYDHLPYLQPSKVTTIDSKGQTITKTIRYPYNFTGTPVYDSLVADYRINVPVEEVETNTTRGMEISRRRTDYQSYSVGLGFIAPSAIRSSVKGQTLHTEQTFTYDQYANIQEITGRDGMRTSYLWGYAGLYPVAELRGISYASIPSTYKSNTQIYEPSSDAALRTLLSGLRNYFVGNHTISTYTYKRLVGMSSITNPGGMNAYYEYDPIGRLALQKNHNQQIVNQYDYQMTGPSSWHLTPNHYTNIPVLRTHYRDCPGGIPQPYNYLVAGGKYISASKDLAITAAENEAAEGIPVPDLPACPSVANTVQIKLGSLYMDNFTLNSSVEVDFIRNGSVVATQRIKHINWNEMPNYDSIYLPEGEYQLSIRLGGDLRFTPDNLLYYYFAVDDGSYDLSFEPGQTVTLNTGTTYTILVANL